MCKGIRLLSILAVMTAACGCASTPDVSAHYYLPKTELAITVARSIACNKEKMPIIEVGVVQAVTHKADEGARQSLSLKALDGALVDATTDLNFYPDGRLSGINAVGTGQGTAIIKSIASLIGGLGYDGVRAAQMARSEVSCNIVHAAGKDGVLTLTYKGEVKFKDEGGRALDGEWQIIPAAPESSDYHKRMLGDIGVVCAKVTEVLPRDVPVTDAEGNQIPCTGTDKEAALCLRHPAVARLWVSGGGANCDSSFVPYWKADILVAQRGTDYEVPLGKAAAFGTTETVVSIDESGALKQLKYGSSSGAGGAAEALGSLVDLASGPSAEEQAKAINAEADLIKATERLAKCKADHKSCE